MFSDTAPSWDALGEMLAAKQLELGIAGEPDLVNVSQEYSHQRAAARRFEKQKARDYLYVFLLSMMRCCS
jgi:hypothetical protein